MNKIHIIAYISLSFIFELTRITFLGLDMFFFFFVEIACYPSKEAPYLSYVESLLAISLYVEIAFPSIELEIIDYDEKISD